MDVNRFFPHKVCINLDRQAERWVRVRSQFRRHDVRSVRRVSAVDGERAPCPPGWLYSPGAYGCLLSHLEVVREAKRLRLPSLLIFEDDVVLHPEFQQRFSAAVRAVPQDWEMLYFGALHMSEPTPVSDGLARISRSYSTYAYALNETMFDPFIQHNETPRGPLDFNLLELQPERRCFCFLPHLAWVEEVYSTTQNEVKDHWYLKESLVMRGREMESLIARSTLILAHDNPERADEATRNLAFLTRYYQSEGIPTVVVEAGGERTVPPDALPRQCRYHHLERPPTGADATECCFDRGVELADRNAAYLILARSGAFLDAADFRANLRMCERFDCATGCSRAFELTRESTRRLREAFATTGIDLGAVDRQRPANPFSLYGFFRRRLIEAAGGWQEAVSSTRNHPVRVFSSPNRALLLSVE